MHEMQGKSMYERCKVDTCPLEVNINDGNEKKNDTCRQQHVPVLIIDESEKINKTEMNYEPSAHVAAKAMFNVKCP